MGLDWCLKDKIRKGEEASHAALEIHLNQTQESLNALINTRVEGDSEFENLHYSQRREFISKMVQEDPHLNEISNLEKCLKTVIGSLTISPFEHMQAPRVGFHTQATEFAEKIYRDTPHLQDRMTLEDYLKQSHGNYVVELAPNQEGVASISGIAVSSTSFRGKAVSYIPWLDSSLKDRAYTDMEPDVLYEYGCDLSRAAEEHSAEVGEVWPGSDLEDDLKILKDASSWCIYWAEAGYSMVAWY